MKIQFTKKSLALTYLAVHLVLFLIFYIPNYVVTSDAVWFDYIRHFLTEMMNYLLPVCAGVAVYNLRGRITGDSVGYAAILASTHSIYLLPYYYLYMLSFGFDSIEAVSISAVITAVGVAVNALHMLAFAFIIRFTVCKIYEHRHRATLPALCQVSKLTASEKSEIASNASVERASDSPFDFAPPANLGIFITVLVQFAVTLGIELYDTITYLIKYAGSYRLGEIVYITLSYVFILSFMLLSQLAAVKLSPALETLE